MYYTYLLRSKKDESFYVGISKDPCRRLVEHNSGILRSTARKRPWVLVFYRQHENCSLARKHEKWLKKKNRKYKESLAQLAPPEIGGVKPRLR